MRRTKAKDKLADMIEEAIDCRIEEIMAYCEKHRLSYDIDIKIYEWGEKRD